MLLIPTENITTLYVRSSINVPLTSLQLVRNLTEKSMCINQLNGTAIYCDYSTNTYDDLSNLNMTFIYDFVSSSYTMIILFDRETNNQVYVSPQVFSGTDISSLQLNSSDLDVQSVWFNSFTQPNGYSLLQPDDLSYAPCLYDEVGCFNTRTYINNIGSPDYSIYKDYLVCVNTLSTTLPENDANRQDFFGGDGLSSPMKILIVILAILFIMGGFIVIGFATPSEKISIIMGSLISVMVLILFTVIGWIPVWILVMMIILALALIIILPSFKEAPSG
jgi:hypothetical protein